MDFKVNANQTVKVKLTDLGVQILRQKHNELHEAIKKRNGKGLSPFKLYLNDDGYYETQLWSLMNDFGHVMTMGYEVPFHLDMIITNGELIAE